MIRSPGLGRAAQNTIERLNRRPVWVDAEIDETDVLLLEPADRRARQRADQAIRCEAQRRPALTGADRIQRLLDGENVIRTLAPPCPTERPTTTGKAT